MEYQLASTGRGGSLLVFTRMKKPLDIMSTYFDHEVWERGQNDPIPDMPLDVQLELINRCNLHCESCPINSVSRKKTTLPWNTLQRIVDEAADESVCYFTICGIGEATMHEDAFKLLGYIRSLKVAQKGLRVLNILPTVLVSNLMWSEAKLAKCLKNPPDLLTVSLAGFTDNEIIKRRGGIDLPKFRKNLEILYTQRSINRCDGGKSPTIHVSTHVHPSEFEHEELKDKFIKDWLRFADAVIIKPTVLSEYYAKYEAFSGGDLLAYDDISQSHYKRTAPCFETSRRLSIDSDGKVWCGHHLSESFGDHLGDANSQGLREIWHGEKMEAFRKEIRAGIFTRPACLSCGGEIRDTHRKPTVQIETFLKYT